MARFFLSHSSVDSREAIALKRWLVEQNPPLDNDIFLDLDTRAGIRPGTKWKDALQQANASCEAVICLLSESWAASTECKTEFRTAENLHKKIFCVRLHPDTSEGITAAWQYVDLFGEGPMTEIDIGSDDSVAFSTAGLLALKEEIVTGIGPESFVWPPPSDPDRAPYRGWSPLEEVDAAVFFGRDAQLIRGLDQLRGMRESNVHTLFVILGPSGSGKSSFLRAGLLPALRREDREFVVLDIVRPERDVLTGVNGLAQSIFATGKRMGLPQPPLAEVKRLCLESADHLGAMLYDIQQAQVEKVGGVPEDMSAPTVILPVDQAEELFGSEANSDQAHRFLSLIRQHSGADIAHRVPLIVALTIRTDHHEKLQMAPELSEVPNKLFDDLKAMPSAQFKEVILGPARRASDGGHGLLIEPGLVERLLKDSRDGADTLPLLSLTLERMYKDWGSDGDLLLSEYVQMGEMRNVVQTEVDDILARDKAEKQKQLEVLRTAFVQHLATINPDNDQPVRRVARWDDLPDDAKPLLEKFVTRRLLVKDKRKDGDVVEVGLESLLRQWDELAQWLDDERENLKHAEALERDAARWEAHGRDDAYLLPGSRFAEGEKLAQNERYRQRVDSVRDFLEASRCQARSTRRRSMVFRAALVLAVVLAVASGLVVYGLKQSSRHNTAQRLVLEAQQMLEGGRSGGDVRALLQLLAAKRLGATTAEAIAESRRDLVHIVENPARMDASENPDLDVKRPVRSIAISADGRRIASGSDDHTMRLYDADTGELRKEVEVGTNHPVWAVAFSPVPDLPFIATGSPDEGLQVWDADGAATGGPMPNSGSVHSVAFGSHAELIATGGDDGKVRVWDRASRTERFADRFSHEPGTLVRSVAFSPLDTRVVASGGDDETVRLWDAQSGTPLNQVAIGERVTSVAFNGVGDQLLVSRADGGIEVRSGRDLTLLREAPQAHPNSVNSAAFSPDGRRIVTGGTDGTVRLWDSATLDPIGSPLTGHHGEIQSVAFNPAGTQIVSAGMDGSVRQWDAIGASPIPAGQGELRTAAFSPSGDRVATAGDDGTIKLWDRATGTQRALLGAPSQAYKAGDDSRAIMSLAFNEDGTRIVAARFDGVVQLWDVDRPAGPIADLPMLPHQPDFKATDDLIASVAFNSAGSMIVAGGNDGAVRLWDAKSRKAFPVITTPYPVWSVAFSPDGNQIATGSGGNDNSLQLWDVATRTAVGEPMVGHVGWQLMSIAFSPDGRLLATGGYDGTVRVWDTAERRELKRLAGDRHAVQSVAFARHPHDHPWLASGVADGALRLWDTSSFEPITVPLRGHDDFVSTVAFSPDDEQILSASRDGTFRLWSSPKDLTTAVCGKVNAGMTEEEWNQWVSDWIGYIDLCPKTG
jgi:WD40 repeat protein